MKDKVKDKVKEDKVKELGSLDDRKFCLFGY